MWQESRTGAKVDVREEEMHCLDAGTCVHPLCLTPMQHVCGGGTSKGEGCCRGTGLQNRLGNSGAMSWGWMLEFPTSGHPKNISQCKNLKVRNFSADSSVVQGSTLTSCPLGLCRSLLCDSSC